MACQPGYIELPNGTCVYEFGSDVQPDGTTTTSNNNGGGFWQDAGDFVKDNAGDILVVLGGILNGGKKSDPADPVSPTPLPEPEKKDRTLLYVGIGIVGLVGIALLVRKMKVAPAA